MTAQPASRQTDDPHIHLVGEICPTCDQPIPHERADEVRTRLAARDRALSEAVAATAARRFAAEKDELVKDHAEEVAKVASETAAKVASARADERQAAEASTQERIAALQKASGEREAALQAKATTAARGRQEAVAQYEALKAEQDQVISHRIQEAREALEKDHREKLNVQAAEHAAEKQKLTDKVADVARQLEKKTAEELGEGAEVKLFEELKAEFSDDRIERVGKGNPGADILHIVIHNGRECGRIIYDSKNSTRWLNDYVAKLLEDQTAAKADHAILCVRKFPADAKQLAVRDGVIIVNPARAMALVQLLRKHMIEVHSLRLSENERAKKVAALYDFINSPQCKLLLGRIDTHAEALLEMQAADMKAHQAYWMKQGGHFRSIQKVKAELENQIERILGTDDGTEGPS